MIKEFLLKWINRMPGIIKRLYYLIAFSVSIISMISLSYFYLFTDQSDPDWEGAGFICLLFLPVAYVFHKIGHWVIWGKIK